MLGPLSLVLETKIYNLWKIKNENKSKSKTESRMGGTEMEPKGSSSYGGLFQLKDYHEITGLFAALLVGSWSCAIDDVYMGCVPVAFAPSVISEKAKAFTSSDIVKFDYTTNRWIEFQYTSGKQIIKKNILIR